MTSVVRIPLLILAAPLFAAAWLFCAVIALIVTLVGLLIAAAENRPPDTTLLWMLVCTCRVPGGPAGDTFHHDRTCLLPRIARHLGRATPEDPETGWVTVERKERSA